MSRFADDALDRQRLEAPKLVDDDYAPIKAERLASLQVAYEQAGLPWNAGSIEAEPGVILEEEDGGREQLVRQSINDALKAASLPFAWDAYLDVAAAALLVKRRQIGEDGNGDPIMEGDEELLARAELAPEAFSVCSAGGYAFTAWGAHPDIKHVACHHIGGNEMKITLLSRHGDGTPSTEILAAADAAIHDADRKNKAGTDVVRVMFPEIPKYSIAVRIEARAGFDKEVLKAAATDSLTTFAANMHKHGERIGHDGINAAAKVAGAFEVHIDQPAVKIDEAPFAAPYCEAILVEVI